jgi:hypothetical protein
MLALKPKSMYQTEPVLTKKVMAASGAFESRKKKYHDHTSYNVNHSNDNELIITNQIRIVSRKVLTDCNWDKEPQDDRNVFYSKPKPG